MNYPSSKPLNQQFTGIETKTKQLLINIFKCSHNVSDKQLFEMLQPIVDIKSIQIENELLKLEKASYIIDSEIHSGKLSKGLRSQFIRLASKDLTTTLSVIESNYLKSIQLSELMKLSARELYLSDKLEDLKALCTASFQIKYNELLAGNK